MKLFITAPSPYARKCRIVAREKGLGNRVREIKLVLEKRRPESERSPSWMQRWTAGIERSLDALEALSLEDEPLHLGTITTAVAATWLGFRHPDTDWLGTRPRLAALTARLEQRESFRETHPAQA